MFRKMIVMMMLLFAGQFASLCTAQSIDTSGNLRLADGRVMFLSCDKYNLTMFRDGVNTGNIMKIQYASTPLIHHLKFIFVSKEYASQPAAQYDKVTVFTVAKINSGFEITSVVEKTFRNKTTNEFVHIADYKTVLKAYDDGRIDIDSTVIPVKNIAMKLFFLQIRLPQAFVGKTVLLDGNNPVTFISEPISAGREYIDLASNFENITLDFPTDSYKGNIKIDFSPENKVELFQSGGFNRHMIQLKSKAVIATGMLGTQPLSFNIQIRVQPEKLQATHIQDNITLQETNEIHPLHKGQFGVGFVNVGGAGKTGINNFVENTQLVSLIQAAGIPYFRFGALYPLLGFKKGWWSTTPMTTDLVYPYDGADLTIQPFTTNQIQALRTNFDASLQISLGPYNPAWMQHPAGTKIQFHAVTDNPGWATFAAKLATYAAANDWNVKVWQVWNEPDAADTWWIGGTFDQYIGFYRAVAKAVKNALPSTLISGPDGTGMAGYNTILIEQFLSGIQDAPLDLYDWHQYGELEYIKPTISKIRGLLQKYGRANTGLYISELGTGNGTSHYLMDGVVYIARAWKRLLEEDVRYINYWNLSSPIRDRGLIDTQTNQPTRMYYLFKMMNAQAKMYDSSLMIPPVTPKGLEVIAVKNLHHYAYMFIKTDAIDRIDLNLDYGSLNAKKAEAYSLRYDRMGEAIPLPVSPGQNMLHYSFKDREVLLLKFIR